MRQFRAYKTEIAPNRQQAISLLKHAGASRWAYNWGLARKIESFKTSGKSPNKYALHKELNVLKKKAKEEGGVPWMYEVSKCAPQLALHNLDQAYANFFRRCKKGSKQKGFPGFKSRRNGVGSFTLSGSITVFKKKIKLPRIGAVKLKEHGYLPCSGVKILSVTVSERVGKWFVALRVEEEISRPKADSRAIGIDVGINSLAVTSDGEVFENPKALTKAQDKLKLLNKSVSRKKKGSNNRQKAVKRLAKQHYRVSNVRRDAMNKATTAIAKLADTIVIESLNVSGMMKNHRLARSIADVGMAEFHRQIEYKVRWRGGKLLRADRYYPSSKTCSRCGNINHELKLSDRIFRCPACGLEIGRDLNAAINLSKMAASLAVTACCPGSSGQSNPAKLLVGQELVKQE